MKKMMGPRKEKCIHCHDVKNGQLRHLQDEGQFSKTKVFTYPDPKRIGVQAEADRQDFVARVIPGTPAARADVRPGEQIMAVAGQRVLTMVEFSQVLQGTPARAALPLELKRNGRVVATTLKLNGNWKTSGAPWWRPSTEVAGPNGGFGRLSCLPRRNEMQGSVLKRWI